MQLREVASSLQLPSDVKLSILQSLNQTGPTIDSVVSPGVANASHQSRTARACDVNQILFGQDGYLDANSASYRNSTQEYWYVEIYFGNAILIIIVCASDLGKVRNVLATARMRRESP